MEPIRVRVEYSVDDYVRAFMFVQRRARRLGLYVMLGIMAVVCFFFFLAELRKSNYQLGAGFFLLELLIPLIIVSSVVFISFRFVNPWMMKTRFRKQFAASPALQEPREIEFNGVGIEGSSFFGGGVTNWPAFIEVRETDTDFYFFTAPKLATFVPKSAFEDDADIETLRHLIVERVGNRAQLN